MANAKTDKVRVIATVLRENDHHVCDWEGNWNKHMLATWKRLGVDLEALDAAGEKVVAEKAAAAAAKEKRGDKGEAEVSRPNV